MWLVHKAPHRLLSTISPMPARMSRAADGSIEAVELDAHPFLLAVQWHPEDTAGDDETQQRLFDALVRRAGG